VKIRKKRASFVKAIMKFCPDFYTLRLWNENWVQPTHITSTLNKLLYILLIYILVC